MNKYKAIITTAGAAKIAAASAGGTQLKIVSMAVGDGNGTLPTPNPAQTKLANEKYRAALNGLTIDKALKNHILAEMIIPANVGGWWLREMGLYDEAGTLIAVSNMAESYKPKLEEGSGRTQTLRMILIVSSTEAIQVIAGGDTVLATKDYVTDAITAHEKTRNHPDASTTAKGLVQLSSATTSTDETKASTPKALKVVNDASMKKAANLSDLTDKAAARGNLALGTAATKNVGVDGGQLMEVGAFGLGGGSRHREDAYCNQAEIYRVNSSSKNTPGGDVYGVLSLPCDGGPSGAYMAVQNNGNAFFGRSNIPSNGVVWFQAYTTKFKPTAADVGALTDAQAAQKYALRSIKVNGKPLSADVNLLAGDVNAWNKTEADGRYVKQAGDKMTGQLIAPSFASTPEAMPNGAGAYVDQLSTQASFFQPNWQWPVNNGGIYVPVAKGTSTRKNQGYPTAVSFGYLMPANSEHAHPTIHAKGDSNVDCAWDFNPYTGKISSKAGTFVTDNWCPFPVGYVMLMGNVSDPNALYPGTKWQDLNGTGYDGRVLSLGYDVMAIGGSNQVTIGAHNLPDHSHRGGMSGPGAQYDGMQTGTDNSGNYSKNLTAGTYTNSTGNEFVRNEPINVTNAYVHVRGWMRVA
ncbi:phage tail protein [Serratia marcescens]|uniref:phage tail protein n=1 Tax=Serratia marcescens TaxID=615 RepID=UPI001BD55971|nr:phage tail protein [Serratia marcescens]